MITLLIISAVLVYAFIGLVVYHIWYQVAFKRCYRSSHYMCEHRGMAGFTAFLWPVIPILVGIFYLLAYIGGAVSNKIEEIVEERIK